jgi:mRNA interferase HicA
MKYSELHRQLRDDGWETIRQKGSHKTLRHPTKKKQLTVPDHGSKEVPKGLELKILKDAGLRQPRI